MAASDVPFTKQMRVATREIHNISDNLINAKLGIAMMSDRVWAEGLLIFYEVFQYLEEALDRHNHSLIGDIDIPGMRRKDLIKKDLDFYLGKDWQKDYYPRESVQKYLRHLEKIEAENPYLLLAFIYHMYMGVLSGGQILRRKKVLMNKLKFSRKDAMEGMAVTEIDTNVYRVKKEITEAMNKIAGELDEETRQRIIEESKMVFVLNNNAVHSIEGAGKVALIKVAKFTVYGALTYILFKYVKRLLFA